MATMTISCLNKQGLYSLYNDEHMAFLFFVVVGWSTKNHGIITYDDGISQDLMYSL